MHSQTRVQLFALLLSLHFGYAMAEDCTSIVAAVLISIAATLAVVGMILLVVYLCFRESKRGQTHIKQGIDTYDNPSFTNDIESGQPQIRLEPNQPGFEGYTLCREYVDSLQMSKKNSNPHQQHQHQQQHQQQQHQQQQQQHHQQENSVHQTAQKSSSANNKQYSQIQTRDSQPNQSPVSCKSPASSTTPAVLKFRKSMNRLGPSQRSGSHASLDEAGRKEAELVSVYLETKDPNGFGMFIDGNMRDGIFINHVQNRGPAKETGLIQKGDRIINMTISMENMVLEDALTIVSYASPYPVRLLIRKAIASVGSSPSSSMRSATVSAGNAADRSGQLFTASYRSQSLNDIAMIVKDSILPCNETTSIKGFSPRRARSEIKRQPLKPSSYYDSEIALTESVEDIQKIYPMVDLCEQDRLDLVQLSYDSDARGHADCDSATISNRKWRTATAGEEEDADAYEVVDAAEGYKNDIYAFSTAEEIYAAADDDTMIEMVASPADSDSPTNEEPFEPETSLYSKPAHRELQFEIERVANPEDIVRGGHQAAGGVSYFVDIDEQQAFRPPVMNTSGFVVKEHPDNNNRVRLDSHA